MCWHNETTTIEGKKGFRELSPPSQSRHVLHLKEEKKVIQGSERKMFRFSFSSCRVAIFLFFQLANWFVEEMPWKSALSEVRKEMKMFSAFDYKRFAEDRTRAVEDRYNTSTRCISFHRLYIYNIFFQCSREWKQSNLRFDNSYLYSKPF